MLGRRGTLVLACAAVFAAAPAAALAQEVSPTTTLSPTLPKTAATATGAASTAASSTGTTTAPAGTTAPPASTTAPPAAPTTAAPTTAAPAAPAATTTPVASGGNRRAGELILLVIGAILVALLVLWGFARWWAWEPPWAVRWRHATAEAGWRASAAWAEFTDWLRLGR